MIKINLPPTSKIRNILNVLIIPVTVIIIAFSHWLTFFQPNTKKLADKALQVEAEKWFQGMQTIEIPEIGKVHLLTIEGRKFILIKNGSLGLAFTQIQESK